MELNKTILWSAGVFVLAGFLWCIRIGNLCGVAPLDYSNLLIASILTITVVFAYRQFKEIRQIERVKNTLDLFKFVQQEDYRVARRDLIRKFGNKEYQDWEEQEKNNAEKAITNYDLAGLYYRKGFIDKDVLIKNWAHSTINCWKAAEDMIIDKRKEYKHSYHPDFEYLYYAALAFYYECKYLCGLFDKHKTVMGEEDMEEVVRNVIEDEDRPKKFGNIVVKTLTELFVERLERDKMIRCPCKTQYRLTKKGKKKADDLKHEMGCEKRNYLYTYDKESAERTNS
jgi:hypothetical protein